MDKTEKRLREEMAVLHDKMKAITEKATAYKRNLTKAEKEEHTGYFDQIQAKRNELEVHLGVFADSGASARPVNDIFGANPQVNKTPAPEVSAKLYKANEKLYTLTMGMDEVDKMPAGAFLRAAMVAPRTATERQAIQASVTSSGFTLPTGVSKQIIDQLRELNPVIQAGAQTIELPREAETNFVTIEQYPDAVWHQELNEESTDAPTFDKVTMKAKTLLSLFEVARELEQDSVNIDEAIRTAFVGSLNDAIITATFTSPGANAPTGLDSLVTQEELYSSLSYATMVKAQRQLYDAHVPKARTSVIHSPANWEDLNTLSDLTTSQPINKPAGIADIPEFVASGCPEDISYTGDFSNVIYGFRMNLTIERHPSASVKKFGALWLAGIRYDLAVFRPSALVRIEPTT